MTQSKSERLRAIHQEAMREFADIQNAVRDERMQCLEDRRFATIAGAQWEGALGEQFENKPKMEVNKVRLATIRIINEYRNNRIDASFMSKDGSDKDDLADTCASLHRADEQDSVAEEAYDNAFDEGATGGIGAWRVRARYEDEEDEEDDRQRLGFEPIHDADSSVFFDLGAKRQDKADAKRCYVLSSMDPWAYEDEWGDDPASWPKEIQHQEFDWATPDAVIIAEYYRVEMARDTVFVLRLDATGEEEKLRASEMGDEDELDAELERRKATGWRLIREKKVKRKRVHKYLLSGSKVLEDCGYIPGPNIPIVMYFGMRWFVDNIERASGHVRLAKDAQRLKNMQLSRLAEIAAMSPYEKPIFTPEQIAGHQTMWAEDNVKNWPYLLINAILDPNTGLPTAIGPASYTKAPELPPAMAALLGLTEQDMQDLLGNQQAGEEMHSNISGKVVELVQQKLSMQTYIYSSNMAKARRRSAEIWLGMAKEILNEEGRKMRGLTESGDPTQIVLRRPMMDKTGKTVNENDLSDASFDITTTLGPTSDSKRASTVRSLTSMLAITDDPETKQVITSMVMMNMDGEGVSDVREYFRRKLIKMGVVKPSKEEAAELEQELANQKPDPNTVFLQASAEQAQAEAEKARTGAALNISKAKEAEASAAKDLADIELGKVATLLQIVDAIGPGETPGAGATQGAPASPQQQPGESAMGQP